MAKKTKGKTKAPLTDMMAEDALLSAEEVGTLPVQKLSALVTEMQDLLTQKEDLEAQLKAVKEGIEDYEREQIPDLMSELGLAQLTTTDGAVVTVSPEVHCSITAANQRKAYAWLRRKGFGDIIKDTVILAFGAGEDEEKRICVKLLKEEEYDFTNKESIHASTLKAFVKEQRANAQPLPTDLFSIFEYQKTKIKRSR